MINTSLCYIEEHGKYLMLHRIKKKNDENHDKWIGIGGKFLDKESPEECVKREVFEETGLVLQSYKYRAIITFVSNEYETQYMHLFTSDKYTGTLKYNCNEGNLEWIEKEKIPSLPIWQGDKIFLDLISKPSEFFSLKLVYHNDTLIKAILNGCETLYESKKSTSN